MTSFLCKDVSHKREKQPTDKITELYFITSLKDTDAIVQSIDNRWKIENDFHKEKDYSFSEDNYIFTDKNAIRVMATMNNIVYAFLFCHRDLFLEVHHLLLEYDLKRIRLKF